MTTEAAPEPSKEATPRPPPRPHSVASTVWFGGWLFTLGFLKLGWLKGLLALLFWPYFLGAGLAPP